jgi:hypothetical protein
VHQSAAFTARQAEDRQRGLCGAFVWRGGPMWLAAQPAQRGAQGDVAGRMSSRSCKSLHKIGDRTAQFVGFQFKERVHQARAMGGK